MRLRTAFAFAYGALALAGCTTPTAPAPPGADARPAPVAETIRGTATYLERIKMPPGASLRVELVDAGSGRTLSTSLMRDVAGPPIPFAIARPAGASPAAGYALRALLLGPRGERWFETPAPVAVPGTYPVELRLRRVATGESAAPPTPAGVAHWECGELGVMSRYEAGAARVQLAFNGHRLALPIARSASGARYADARGNEFWTKGATGRLALAGEPARDCVEAAQPSPWNTAAQQGVAFRAVGSEPGWSVQVAGTPAMLDAQLDYGERRLRVPVTAVQNGFEGEADGKPLHLRAERRACQDGMSGQSFEATVTLEAGGRTYRGCGAWLQD
ncbi:MliC family protein [Cognatilysobacter segetis]|uniref:MliC family protein n=1 Tax=Cognatilysobacter segetis TaxID=2492394 RepID=UPI00105EB439|nr:MliC family protein [Lysobacter segetis]